MSHHRVIDMRANLMSAPSLSIACGCGQCDWGINRYSSSAAAQAATGQRRRLECMPRAMPRQILLMSLREST
jgi:hypothetical protein